MKIENLSANDLSRILGKEVQYAFATRRELGESMKYGFEMLHQVINELKMDKE